MSASLIDEIVKQLQILPDESQRRVLEFTRALVIPTPRGVPGRYLLEFAGTIPPDDLKAMREAIEQGCEQVDWNEW